MKLELNLPDGVRLRGLYLTATGWGAVLSCTPGFWPSRYAKTFADVRSPHYPAYHSCSTGSTGCASPQAAIDTAFDKLRHTMDYLDGIQRAAGPTLGIDLGALDL